MPGGLLGVIAEHRIVQHVLRIRGTAKHAIVIRERRIHLDQQIDNERNVQQTNGARVCF